MRRSSGGRSTSNLFQTAADRLDARLFAGNRWCDSARGDSRDLSLGRTRSPRCRCHPRIFRRLQRVVRTRFLTRCDKPVCNASCPPGSRQIRMAVPAGRRHGRRWPRCGMTASGGRRPDRVSPRGASPRRGYGPGRGRLAPRDRRPRVWSMVACCSASPGPGPARSGRRPG